MFKNTFSFLTNNLSIKINMYTKITKPLVLFDVTLRDGIQCMKDIIPLEKKKMMYNHIISTYLPTSVEIGSLVSSKAVPQMIHTLDLYKYAEEISEELVGYTPNLYVLVPPYEKYINQAKENNIRNISIMNSVSDSFQIKNVKLNIKDTYNVIQNIRNNKEFDNIKLYLSCINYCPVSKNKININTIISYIKEYIDLDINEICLSDTAGTLTENEFKILVKRILLDDIEPKNISFHFHKNKNNNSNVIKNTLYALQHGFKHFDVSNIETGGCHMTLSDKELSPNMSYTDIHKSFNEYMYPTFPKLAY